MLALAGLVDGSRTKRTVSSARAEAQCAWNSRSAVAPLKKIVPIEEVAQERDQVVANRRRDVRVEAADALGLAQNVPHSDAGVLEHGDPRGVVERPSAGEEPLHVVQKSLRGCA